MNKSKKDDGFRRVIRSIQKRAELVTLLNGKEVIKGEDLKKARYLAATLT